MFELTSEGAKLLQYARQHVAAQREAYASMSDDVLTGFVRLGVPLDFFGRDFTTWLAGFKAGIRWSVSRSKPTSPKI